MTSAALAFEPASIPKGNIEGLENAPGQNRFKERGKPTPTVAQTIDMPSIVTCAFRTWVFVDNNDHGSFAPIRSKTAAMLVGSSFHNAFWTRSIRPAAPNLQTAYCPRTESFIPGPLLSFASDREHRPVVETSASSLSRDKKCSHQKSALASDSARSRKNRMKKSNQQRDWCGKGVEVQGETPRTCKFILVSFEWIRASNCVRNSQNEWILFSPSQYCRL